MSNTCLIYVMKQESNYKIENKKFAVACKKKFC